MKLENRLRTVIHFFQEPNQENDGDEEVEYWKELGNNRDSHDKDALKRCHEDVQLTLDRHLEVFKELAEKSGRLFRFNGLVLTLLVAVASQTNFQRFVTTEIMAGIVLLVASGLIGVLGQFNQRVVIGPGGNEFSILNQGKLRETEYLRWIISTGYIEWIEEAGIKSKKKWIFVEFGYLFSVIGLIVLFWGIFMSL